MRMLIHDKNTEQKDREKLKYKANVKIGELGNASLRQSGLVSIKVDHVAMLYCLKFIYELYKLLKCSYLPYILCIRHKLNRL